MGRADAWMEDARNGAPLDDLFRRFPVEVDSELKYFPEWLTFVDRWADVRRLQNHENSDIATTAKSEWRIHLFLMRASAEDDQRIAALTGVVKEISDILGGIKAWIATIHYPWRSTNVPESNCCLMGDGCGMAYFTFDGDAADTVVQVVKVAAEDMARVFESFGIYQGSATTLGELRNAVLAFRFRQNRKQGME